MSNKHPLNVKKKYSFLHEPYKNGDSPIPLPKLRMNIIGIRQAESIEF